MTLPPDTSLSATFHVNSAGSVYLQAFSAGSSSYNTATLRACLQHAGQAPCAPAPFPNPAYWTITTADLARWSSYQLIVTATVSGGFVGFDFGWNGPRQFSLSGIDLPGACKSGYTDGCGLRFRFGNGAAGSVVVNAGPGVLHLKVKDKATGTVACDTQFSGSATCSLPYVTEWTGYLYPQASQPISPAALTVTWP